uniref:Odorant receptor n=1 Tax=Glossina palpalis gambiensis TaxID=67801 RepID=A0A1B0BI33_9MUSC
MVVACVDRYRKLIRVARICAAICGADFADENYNPWNPLVFITLSSIVFFAVGTGYTIYAGLVYDNDWTVILQSLCLASSAFQGLAKYIFSLIRRRLIVNIIKSIDDIYLECQKISENYRVILAKTSDKLLLNIYIECLWYELTVQQQQMILLMLIKSQSPVVLNIGKVMPLSLSSALQLTKAIYSFLMMLLNFLE